ncbi:MAG: peptidylprolyl isomerase [Desulfuromonas sp.]|nr:MAG: peptidylprolyl isomerase [Desulfuromonas sp.]
MATAQKGDRVRVKYTGKLDDGQIFDSSEECGCGCDEEEGPLEFVIGEEELLPGFEEAVIGMSIQEKKEIKLVAEDAYGPWHEEMVMAIERSEIPEDIELEIDNMLEVTDEDGSAFPVRITEVTDTTVTLDANHPLSGEDLTFEIELVEIL